MQLFYCHYFNPLTPNDPYMGRTAPLTSKCCILYFYSTNIGTEYFKHALHSPFFFSSKCSLFHNANFFGVCIIHILYTGCAEIKKNNSGAKRVNALYRTYFTILYYDKQMHTIISQIITLLHISTISCHPQGTCNQYLAK